MLRAAPRVRVPFQIGTMIEVPRAALTADGSRDYADFFSFGTNDLTQMTYALSRDDAGAFLPDLPRARASSSDDPFVSIDEDGHRRADAARRREGARARPKLKLGICGEHGGDPKSVRVLRARRASTTCRARRSACRSRGSRRRRRRSRPARSSPQGGASADERRAALLAARARASACARRRRPPLARARGAARSRSAPRSSSSRCESTARDGLLPPPRAPPLQHARDLQRLHHARPLRIARRCSSTTTPTSPRTSSTPTSSAAGPTDARGARVPVRGPGDARRCSCASRQRRPPAAPGQRRARCARTAGSGSDGTWWIAPGKL